MRVGRAWTAAGELGAAPSPPCRGGGSGAPCTEGLGLMWGGSVGADPLFPPPPRPAGAGAGGSAGLSAGLLIPC